MTEYLNLSTCECSFLNAPMMELVYVLDLKSRFWGFESHWEYQLNKKILIANNAKL